MGSFVAVSIALGTTALFQWRLGGLFFLVCYEAHVISNV